MNANQILTEAGLNNSFWGGRIIRAEERGRFTKNDRVKAGDWTTCACGRLDDGISRYADWPMDVELRYLGIDFTFLVRNDLTTEAADTLIDIEKRAAAVLEALK